jgi:hypothetical protein
LNTTPPSGESAMPSIFDLVPASLWPVQPFMPPLDPTQPSRWPSSLGSNSAVPAVATSPFTFPTTPVSPHPYADDSVSDWDRAMRQALAAQRSATRAPDIGDSAASDQMLADAKRAHDFAMWAFGPPSAPQTTPMSGAMASRSPQYAGGAPSSRYICGRDAAPDAGAWVGRHKRSSAGATGRFTA